MFRRALLAAAAAALTCTGAASAYLLARPSAPRAGTTSTATTTTTTATVTTAARTAIVVSGHGWGHGLGMSQWGAYGYAKHGWTYDRILAHYYTGTTLGPAPVAKVRVLLVDGAKKVVLASTTPWKATDASGAKQTLPAGKLTLTPSLTVAGTALQSPLVLAPSGSPLLVGTKPYRGQLVVTADGGKLQVVNSLGLEAYLKGVVPSEMPSSWAPEALKAQAVAARSYALSNITKGRGYDLYSDTRSQVYGGIAAEAAATNQAVDATAGQVVLYDGKVATTLFFSTSGGQTLSAAEATGRAVPYLVGVPDPYDDASPYHNWGPVLLDAAAVAKQLKLPDVTDLRTTPGPSGRIAKVTVVSSTGQTTLTGGALRTALGLRSTWFGVAWLGLSPPAAPVTYGGAASLTGLARGLGAASLESRIPGGTWAPAGAVAPDATGAFSTIVRPLATTEYRVAAANVRAGLARVAVVPLVTAKIAGGVVSGTVRPLLAGAPVQVQRQAGITWTTVATATTDAAGAFSTPAELLPGTYRVRCAPGRGLSPGVSPTLQVA